MLYHLLAAVPNICAHASDHLNGLTTSGAHLFRPCLSLSSPSGEAHARGRACPHRCPGPPLRHDLPFFILGQTLVELANAAAENPEKRDRHVGCPM